MAGVQEYGSLLSLVSAITVLQVSSAKTSYRIMRHSVTTSIRDGAPINVRRSDLTMRWHRMPARPGTGQRCEARFLGNPGCGVQKLITA